MENILLNAEFYGLDLPNINEIQTLPTEQDWKEVENNNEYQNEAYVAPKEEEQKHVFAVPKIYNCIYCEKRFYNEKAIRRHQLNHANQLLRCSRCGMRSHNIGNLRRHSTYFHHGNNNEKSTTSKQQ
jgi:DNA-directed RNA polymerase subunit RPC12/RpoP